MAVDVYLRQGHATPKDVQLYPPGASGTPVLDVGLAVETDVALTLTLTKQRSVGLAVETDSALARPFTKLKSTGLAVETDSAIARPLTKRLSVGLAVETDSAFARSFTKRVSVGLSTETDVALARPFTKQRSVGLAIETDAAFARPFTKQISVGRADETDFAYALVYDIGEEPMAAGSVEISVTPELQPYYTAQEVRITLTVRDIDGNLSVPGNLSLRILRPDDLQVTYTLGLAQLTEVTPGVYYYDLLIDLSYQWRLRAEASGGVNATDEHELAVHGSVFSVTYALPVPGSGHEGEIARVTGGVYQPYAGTPGKVLGWVAGQGWIAVAISGLPGAAAGGPQELQYNNGGAFDGTASIKVGGVESQLLFYGSSGTEIPSSAGGSLLNVFHGAQIITARNFANTQNGIILSWGTAGNDVILLGDGGTNAQTWIYGKAGHFVDMYAGGVLRFRAGAAGGNFSLDNITFGSLAIEGTAWLRAPANTTIVAARNFDNTVDDVVLSTAIVGSTTELTIGQGTGDLVQIRAKATGGFSIELAGTIEYAFGTQGLNMQDNYLAFGIFASTPYATAGQIRFASLNTIYVRNIANTQNIRVLEMGDNLSIGDGGANGNSQLYLDVKAAGVHVVRVNNVSEFEFTATALTMQGNNLLMGAGFASFGTNPAASGEIRWSHGRSLFGRNNANSADRRVLAWGVSANDEVALGNTTTDTWLHAGTTVGVLIGSTQVVRIDTAKVFLANTSAAPSIPTGGGHIYEESGAFKHHGTSGTITTMAAA